MTDRLSPGYTPSPQVITGADLVRSMSRPARRSREGAMAIVLGAIGLVLVGVALW